MPGAAENDESSALLVDVVRQSVLIASVTVVAWLSARRDTFTAGNV